MANELQRLQRDTRTMWIPETDGPGVDPAAPVKYVVPLAGENGVTDTQDPARMAIGMGDGLADSKVAGLIRYGGALPMGLDYDFQGFPLAAMYTGYAHVGATKLHEFFEDAATAGARPQSFQLQDEYLEATAKYVRSKFGRLSELSCRGDAAGGAAVSANVTGNGDVVETDVGGSVTDYGFEASNYFDGQIKVTVGGTTFVLSGASAINAFMSRLVRPVSAEPAFFNEGKSSQVNIGVLDCITELGIPMLVGAAGPAGDLNLYSYGKNRNIVSIDFMLANGPLLTCSGYWRRQIVAALIWRARPRTAPGNGGLSYNATAEIARMALSSMKAKAEYHSTIRGPYNIGATTKVVGAKIDGVAKSVTLTEGAARTTDQVVTDLMNDAAFAAVAVADNFLGYVRITTKTAGSAGSVQIDTGVASTAHAAFGFDNVVRAGRDKCQVRDWLLSPNRTTNYR